MDLKMAEAILTFWERVMSQQLLMIQRMDGSIRLKRILFCQGLWVDQSDSITRHLHMPSLLLGNPIFCQKKTHCKEGFKNW